MPEQPMIPPPGVAVRDFTTPDFLDGYFVQRISTKTGEYPPIPRGTLYSTTANCDPEIVAQFPPLYFLRENSIQGSDEWATRIWSTDPQAEDTYNAEVSYLGESITNPSYVRSYTVRRSVYDSSPTLATGTTLTALLGVTITGAGTDYTFATGTVGTATITFVCSGGAIVSGVVTKSSSGITAGASITITGDGTGATATAIVQSASAILTAQKKTELSPDDPRSHLYVRVTRVYEVLPGPWVDSTRFDEDGATVTVRKRRNIAANITTAEAIAAGELTKTSKEGTDANVATEVVEKRPIPGNPIPGPDEIDPDSSARISTVKTIVESSTVTPSAVIDPVPNPHTLVVTKLEPISDLVGWEVVTTTGRAPSFYDSTHFLTSQKSISHKFPARIDLRSQSIFGETLGVIRPSADFVLATIEEWWEIAATQPAITVDSVIPGSAGVWTDVLHDGVFNFGAGVAVLTEATTPSFTAYQGTRNLAIAASLDFVSGSGTATASGFDPRDYFVAGQILPLYGGYTITAVASGGITISPVWAPADTTASFYTLTYNSDGWVGTLKIIDAFAQPVPHTGSKLWHCQRIKVIMR